MEPDPPDQELATEPEPVPRPSCALGEFGPLEKIAGLGLNQPLWGPVLSAADTALFFVVTVSSGAEQIFFASRSDMNSAQFSTGNPVPELASNGSDGTPFVSASGLRLYFYSTRGGSNGGGSRDLWFAERPTPGGAFAAPVPLLELNSASGDLLPRVSADELSIVFTSQRPEGRGATDIWEARRSSVAAPFAAPVNLAEVNTDVDDTGAWLSADGLTLFFSSNRAGGQGRLDIWRATRTGIDQPFGPAEDVPGLNSPSDELDISLSSDERELLLSSDRDGVPALWRAVRGCQ
jgi:Tol biopolymer transport system component